MNIIAGPCVIETGDMALSLAREIKKISDNLGIEIIFKASFDKANRSSVNSYRGLGMERGIDVFKLIKRKVDIKIITDIHESYQAKPVSQAVDILQIPAFLCRQTDLLAAAASTGKIIAVKKGQFLSPDDMRNVVDKLRNFDAKHIWLMERGTFFGYNRLVNDMTAIPIMKGFDVPVIFDATHSVQRPGGLGESSGGNREFVGPLAKAATAIGADGLFFEVHHNPDKALSDGANMLKISELEPLLREILAIRKVVV